MDALSERVDFVVEAAPPDVAAVSVLGSFADGGEEELRVFVREWKATRPGLDAQVEPDDRRGPTVVPITRETAAGGTG